MMGMMQAELRRLSRLLCGAKGRTAKSRSTLSLSFALRGRETGFEATGKRLRGNKLGRLGSWEFEGYTP